MHKIKSRGIPVLFIWLDPAGENLKLEKRASSVDWTPLQPLEFEFTSRDTPQHNNLAELAFPYLAGRARAMIGAANIPNDIRGKVAMEALKCATQLDRLKVVTLGNQTTTCDILMFGKNPNWAKNLHTWGQAIVVKEGKDGKTGDCGKLMMFVGYPSNGESDSVRMWNPTTNQVVTTRVVIWLKRMFFESDNSSGFELDPSQTTEDAKEDTDILSDVNEDAESKKALARHIKFIDKVGEDSPCSPAASEGTKLNATVTHSGRVSKPLD